MTENHKVIQNHIYMVSGLPGSGKSFFVCFLCSFYPIIYSNLEIKRFGEKRNNTISSIQDINFIQFDNDKGVIVLEESGVNINSRRSLSEENMEFSKLSMLGRKKNKDLIYVSQLVRTVDINIRELSVYKFEMKSYHIGSNRLMFEVTIKDRFDNMIGVKELDLTSWAEESGWTYSTLEDSIIRKEDKEKKYGNALDTREIREKLKKI